MTVTKQQQLEWLAKNLDSWHEDGDRVCVVRFDNGHADPYFPVVHPHGIRKREWQQERDKMQKQQDNSWHERGEFPPAGCECEVKETDGKWHTAFIVGVDNAGYCVYTTEHSARSVSYEGDRNKSNFRPLRTEREKAIDELNALVGDIEKYPTWRDAIAAIVDAGYHK